MSFPEGAATSPPRWSVAARITAWYAITALLFLLGIAAALDWALASTLYAEEARLAERERTELIQILHETPDSAEELNEEVLRDENTPDGIRLWMRVRDLQGNTLVESPGMSGLGLGPGVFPPPGEAARPWVRGRGLDLPSGMPVRTFASLATLGSGQEPARILEIAIDCTSTRRILARFRERLALATSGGFLVLLFVGYAIARRGLEPVRSIAVDVHRIGSTNLYERINISGLPPELWMLATTFNELLGRLDASFLRLAQFSADIAHELRTPLSRMRLAAEFALNKRDDSHGDRAALEDCLEEAVKLSRLIDGLLFLARAEGPQSFRRDDVVDVRALLATVADYYRAPAEDAQILLVVESGSHMLRVDRQLVLQAIGNLVQNALSYTPAGGRIHLSAVPGEDAVAIEVRDDGCGIPESHLGQIFDAFHRVDRARSTASGGTGLGLAIVKKIARLHGGDVQVKSAAGAGTTVTMTLPCIETPGAVKASALGNENASTDTKLVIQPS